MDWLQFSKRGWVYEQGQLGKDFKSSATSTLLPQFHLHSSSPLTPHTQSTCASLLSSPSLSLPSPLPPSSPVPTPSMPSPVSSLDHPYLSLDHTNLRTISACARPCLKNTNHHGCKPGETACLCKNKPVRPRISWLFFPKLTCPVSHSYSTKMPPGHVS